MCVCSRSTNSFPELVTLLQVAEDPLWFQDPAFVVTPMEGLAWAHSDMEFTITFTPDVAANYACCAYLEVTGRELRLPLQLRGVGIGPKAVFSSDIVDIGDVFVTSTHSYELVLTNKGDILAEYKFKVPKTPFASKFKFVPDNGSLALGQSQRIAITFCSDILGEFAQTFDVAMKGEKRRAPSAPCPSF